MREDELGRRQGIDQAKDGKGDTADDDALSGGGLDGQFGGETESSIHGTGWGVKDLKSIQ